MLEPKVFAGGSTTLPKPVREALGVKAGDTVRFLVSDNGVLWAAGCEILEFFDAVKKKNF